MKICIYRGTDEIGGNCIEISTNKTRILLDIGTPLSSMDEKNPLETYKNSCCGVYQEDTPTIDAIFISHTHRDHYGLLPIINTTIPVYMSKITHDILTKIEPLLPDDFDVSNLDIHEIDSKQTIKIKDLKITAFAVDHIPGAMAYEITDGKKRIVYTGDFRFHSNQKWKSWALADLAANPDYLIMEGTRLSRTEDIEEYNTENSVYRAITKLLRESNNIAFATFSSQNLDRLVSFIKASIASNRTLVIDPYTATLLDVFNNAFATVPTADMLNNIRIYFGTSESIATKMKKNGLFYKHKDKKITKEEILATPNKFILKYNKKLADWLLKKCVSNYDFIYSMWHGYLESQTTWDKHKEHIVEIHTSGHADIANLQKFVKRIKPKTIIPIHTECKNDFQEKFGVKTLVLNDNESKEI